MGRPKGSKNKVHKNKKAHKKCRRGRPKGSIKKVPTESYDMSNVKTYKFLGFCKKCEMQITTKELVSKFIYECPGCGKRNRIKKLLKELVKDRPKNKKEYLDSTIHASHIDSIPNTSDIDLGPDDLKVQE